MRCTLSRSSNSLVVPSGCIGKFWSVKIPLISRLSDILPLICIWSPPVKSDPPIGEILIWRWKVPDEKILDWYVSSFSSTFPDWIDSFSIFNFGNIFHFGPIVIGSPFFKKSYFIITFWAATESSKKTIPFIGKISNGLIFDLDPLISNEDSIINWLLNFNWFVSPE